jgi:ribonucleoside-diphosphate reductase alpha chain
LEEPLPAGGSCLLGAINISEFVINEQFDFAMFNGCVHDAVQYLNEILDEGLLLHPLEEQRKSVSEWRQIGLGIMGVADALIKLKIKYGSEESIKFLDKLATNWLNNAVIASALLASELGSFEKFNLDNFKSSTMYRLLNETAKNTVEKYGLRNSQLLTIAPTGTISTMIGVSGGIEPIYQFSYSRKTQSLYGEDKTYEVFTPIVKEYMDQNNIQSVKDLPKYFIHAGQIKYQDRIKVQAILQKYIDASISSTINLPEKTTIEDVKKIYIEAWKNGLKGITIFRDNCDRAGILTTNNKMSSITIKDLPYGTTLEMSDDLIGKKRKIVTGCGNLHIAAWFDPIDGNLMEVYLSKGSDGGCNSYMIGLSRMISAAMRTGLSFDIMIDQLKSSPSCASYAVRTATKKDTSKGKCCPDGIANALISMRNEVLDELGVTEDNYYETIQIKGICPSCQTQLKHEEGCITCPNCGWSKCD